MRGGTVQDLPDVYVIGAPKCATTSFHYYLDAHPDIVCMQPKESHFLLADQFPVGHHLASPDDVRRWFRKHPARVRCDVGVHPMFYDVCRRRVREWTPGAKVLAFVRDPVDLMYSLYSQHVKLGMPDVGFERAFRAGRPAWPEHDTRWPACPPYAEVGRLKAVLAPWLEDFGADMKVVHFDDIRTDAQAVYDDILAWLGLAPHTIPPRLYNPDGRIRSRRLHRFFEEPPRWIAVPYRVLFGPLVRRRIMARLKRLNTSVQERPGLDPVLEARLRDDYAEDAAFVAGFRQLAGAPSKSPGHEDD